MRKRANEVLCIHGTTKESASHIADQGFDDRLANREVYGRGMYCTTDACKAVQLGRRLKVNSHLVDQNPECMTTGALTYLTPRCDPFEIDQHWTELPSRMTLRNLWRPTESRLPIREHQNP